MSSETKKRKKRNILLAGFIVFVLGAVVGIGGMTFYSHFKSLQESKSKLAKLPEPKIKETKVVEDVSADDIDAAGQSEAYLDHLDTEIVMNDNKKSVTEGSSSVSGVFDAYFKSCDWGTQLLRVVMTLDAPIDEAYADDWCVVEKIDEEGHEDEYEKKITDAFLLTADGERTEEPSNYLCLEFYTAPEEEGGPFWFNKEYQYYEYPDEYEIEIDLVDGAPVTSKGIFVEEFHMPDTPEDVHTGVDAMSVDEYETAEGTTYSYAHYEAKDKDGKPADTLVVFLHGLTSGGWEDTDALVTAQTSNVAMLLSDSFQDTMGGASILVPQCPTYWMNQNKKYGDMEWITYNPYIMSAYTESLHQMINYYKRICKADRVIIAGASNGGFMTLLMALHYETEYDGYVCISEAMWDMSITDEHTRNLAKLPLYFIYCNNDTTASPASYSIPTISRIRAYGKKNLHASSFDKVTDLTGTYYSEAGGVYEFNPHQAEIYFFRNNAPCNDCGVGVWEWMAKVGR